MASPCAAHHKLPVKPSTLPLWPRNTPCAFRVRKRLCPISALGRAGAHVSMKARLSGLSSWPSRRAEANVTRSRGDEIIPPAVHSTERFDPVTSIRPGLTIGKWGETPAS
jgi:hypothetical protein